MKLSYLHNNRTTRSSYPSFRNVIILFLILSMMFYSISPVKISKADANSQVNVQVDYLQEIVTVSAGTGLSTKFYMSTDKVTWEVIDAPGVVDISTFLTSKAATLYFKGNKDLSIVTFPIAVEDGTLQLTYKITEGNGSIVTVTGGALTIEYRNGSNGSWKTFTNNMSTALYEIKGTTMYFRTIAATARRAGKIVTIKIPKRPSAPSVRLDGSKICISGLKSGQTQYRVGDSTIWQPFSPTDSKSTTLDLNTVQIVSGSAITLTGGMLEFRTVGSDKKVNSAVKVIEISPQAAAPENVALDGSKLTVTDTDSKKTYEYCVVSQNSTFSLSSVRWTIVTSKKPVIIPRVSVNDKIYVRVKSTTDPDSKIIILASAYKILTVQSITTNTQ